MLFSLSFKFFLALLCLASSGHAAPTPEPASWFTNMVHDLKNGLDDFKQHFDDAWKKGETDVRKFLADAKDTGTSHYEPITEPCPSTPPSIRPATGLSPEETAWLGKRRSQVVGPMTDFLSRLNISGFDAAAYLTKVGASSPSAIPNIAIAASGGGYRAMLSGAGAIKAFDSRTADSTRSTMAGLLQSSTYVAGLSGGSWLVGSLYINNFTDVATLQNSGSLWDISRDLMTGPNVTDSTMYWIDLMRSVSKKSEAGFKVTITDLWSRALSWQMINGTDGGPAPSWSSIAQNADFLAGNIPMPIVVADGRAPDQTLIPDNTTVFEFTPWELGSFDGSLAGFAPLAHLGCKFVNGAVPAGEKCWRNFDNAGFVMGTSSSLFNAFLPRVDNITMEAFAKTIAKAFLKDFSDKQLDIANYSPSPFLGWNNDSNAGAHSSALTLVDGGEDNEVLPLHPLIQNERQVDVIFSLDNSGDVNGWANGNSLIATATRQQNNPHNDRTSFPAIPDNNTMINLGLTNQPTFFGCNDSSPTPLVVWLPNAPYSYAANVSTFKMKYTRDERDGLIQNGFDLATQGNGQLDSTWATCAGCAILARSWAKTSTPVPAVCQACFAKHCWNGTLDASPPPAYNPALKLSSLTGQPVQAAAAAAPAGAKLTGPAANGSIPSTSPAGAVAAAENAAPASGVASDDAL